MLGANRDLSIMSPHIPYPESGEFRSNSPSALQPCHTLFTYKHYFSSLYIDFQHLAFDYYRTGGYDSIVS